MKAIHIERFGIDNVTISEVEKPQITADEILVRVHSFALNYMDILLIEGHYNPNLTLPHVPGSDASGVVEAVGKNVTEYQVGDQVITHFFIDWQSGRFKSKYFNHRYGSEGRGVFAEYIAVSANGLVRKPASLTFEQAATLPIAGLTAWSSIIEETRLFPGQNILILGTGGVSIFAVQIAQLIGLNIAVVSGSEEAIAKVQELGVTQVINYRTHPDWEDQVLEHLPGGAHLVIDVVGDIRKSMKVLAPNGTVKVVGFVGTSTSEFDVFTALMTHANIIASTPGSKETFENFLQALTVNPVKPVIDQVFDFDQIQAALHYMKQGKHIGKIVVKVP